MNCYEAKRIVRTFDLLIAEDSEFDLTRNKVYVAKSDGFGDILSVVNDKGVLEQYSTEYFRFYNGETIGL